MSSVNNGEPAMYTQVSGLEERTATYSRLMGRIPLEPTKRDHPIRLSAMKQSEAFTPKVGCEVSEDGQTSGLTQRKYNTKLTKALSRHGEKRQR